MYISMRRIAVAGILLSGCFGFAAQALRHDNAIPASASQLDKLVATAAICPELVPLIRNALDQSQGVILKHQADRAIAEGQACMAYRSRLNEQAHHQLAYSSISRLIEQQTPKQSAALPRAPHTLKLSLELSEKR